MQAKKGLKVDWEVVGELENSDMHLQRLEKALVNGEVEETRKDGDVDAAFKKATKVIERTYSSPFMAHNTMEPMNFFANVTADAAELVGPTQTPEALEGSVAKLLGMPLEKVTVNMTRI